MTQLQKILKAKSEKERAEIERQIRKDTLLADVADMTKEIKVWHGFVHANTNNLKPKEVAEALKVAKMLVEELLLLNVK